MKTAPTNINIRLKPEVRKALRVYCAQHETTAQRVVEALVETWLATVEAKELAHAE